MFTLPHEVLFPTHMPCFVLVYTALVHIFFCKDDSSQSGNVPNYVISFIKTKCSGCDLIFSTGPSNVFFYHVIGFSFLHKISFLVGILILRFITKLRFPESSSVPY